MLTTKRKYVLADMIAQCDLNAPPPADLALWDVAQPTGGETLWYGFNPVTPGSGIGAGHVTARPCPSSSA
jgi:hypothetical protein